MNPSPNTTKNPSSDLVERLNTRAASLRGGGPKAQASGDLMSEAASRIQALEGEVERLKARETVHELNAQVFSASLGRAVGALRPFAMAFEMAAADTDGTCITVGEYTAMRDFVQIQDYRNAAQFLSSLPGDQGVGGGSEGGGRDD